MVGSTSARRSPMRWLAMRALSWASVAATPRSRPMRIASSKESGPEGPAGGAGCWAASGPASSARENRTGRKRIVELAVEGRSREDAVQDEVDQALQGLLVAQRFRVELAEKALRLGGLDQQHRQSSRREAVGRRAKLARRDAALEHPLDQATARQDNLLHEEARQLGEALQLRVHQLADPAELLVPHHGVLALEQLDEEIAARALERIHEGLALAHRRDRFGVHHLTEQRFLGIEVEIECALADAGQPGDILELGLGEAVLPEDLERGVEDLLGSRLRSPLPAGSGGRDWAGVVVHGWSSFSNCPVS